MRRLITWGGPFRVAVCAAGVLACGALTLGQTPEPRKQFGAGVTGAYEGWFTAKDGSRWFSVGYYNRNSQQDLDVPVGPDNRIEPGGPDQGQPTHFMSGRHYGMFMLPVPKNFGPDDRLTWTIVANGQSSSIPLRLHPDYVIEPFTEVAAGNTPPALRFTEGGPFTQGPVARVDAAWGIERTATVGTPFPLTLWTFDDMKYQSSTGAPVGAARSPVTMFFSKYRGPGQVKFDKDRPAVEKLTPSTSSGQAAAPFNGKATANITFSEPGDYIVHVTANDYSGDGGGGFLCCWTTTMAKVKVSAR